MFQWTALKEHILMDAVVKYNKSWGRIATCIPGSDAKECHERYEQLKQRGYRSPPKNITILPKPAKKRKKAMSSPIEPLKVLTSNMDQSELEAAPSSIVKPTTLKSPITKGTSSAKPKVKKSPKGRKKPKLASSPVFGLARDSPFTTVSYRINFCPLPPPVYQNVEDLTSQTPKDLIDESTRKETSLMKKFRESVTPPSVSSTTKLKSNVKKQNNGSNVASPLQKYPLAPAIPKLLDSTSPLLDVEAGNSSATAQNSISAHKSGQDLGFSIKQLIKEPVVDTKRNQIQQETYLESLFSDQLYPLDEIPAIQMNEDPDIPHEEFEDLFNDTLKEKTYDVLLKQNHQIDWVFDSSKCFSKNQIQELKDQLGQMFQLTMQSYIIESELANQDEKGFWKDQLNNFGRQRDVGLSIAGESSVFNISAIHQLSLVFDSEFVHRPEFARDYNTTDKKVKEAIQFSDTGEQILNKFCSDLSLYPKIIPTNRSRIREFLPSEDVLLYNGLINFGLQDIISIHIHYLPAKPVNQIRQRINNVRRRSKSFNFIKDFYLLPFKPMTVNEKMLLKNGINQYGVRFKDMTPIVFPHIPWYLIVAAWDELYLIGAVKVHYEFVECPVEQPVQQTIPKQEIAEITFDDIFEIESPEKPTVSPEISPNKRVSFSQFISPLKSPTKSYSPVRYEMELSHNSPKSPVQIFKERLNSPKQKKGRKGKPQRSTTLNQEILPAWNSDFETDYEYSEHVKKAVDKTPTKIQKTPRTPQDTSLPKISFAGMLQFSESEDDQYDYVPSSPIIESLLTGKGKGKLPRTRHSRKINRDRIDSSISQDNNDEAVSINSDVPFLNTRSKKRKPSKCDSKVEVIRRKSEEKPLPFQYSLFCGAVAGVSEILTMYPLDVVKTRFQIQVGQAEYSSIVDCFQKMVKNEGFGSLYRGILPPIFVEAPKRAIKFGANDQYKHLYQEKFGFKDGVLFSMLTGSSAGMTEAVIVSTPDLIKIRMQDKRNAHLYKGTSDVAAKIWQTEGLYGFGRGIEATVWRHGVWNMGYFGVISFVRAALPKAESKQGKLLNNFVAGTIGGTVGTILNTPFDVVKTRVQSQISAPYKYNWAVPAIGTIIKEEGAGALYKGFVPKVLRLGPALKKIPNQMSNQEGVAKTLKSLSVAVSVTSHNEVDSFNTWVESVKSLQSEAGAVKTLVLKPSKGPNNNLILVVALSTATFSVGNVAKSLGYKDARMAADDLVSTTFGVDKLNLTPFAIENVQDKSTVTVVVDENIVNNGELNLAFRHFSATETFFVKSAGFKQFLDAHAGEYQAVDYNNLTAPAAAPGSPKAKKTKEAEKTEESQVIIGLTVTKEENFPKWYEQVLTKTEMLDYYDVSGCYIIRPNAFAVWKKIQQFFGTQIEELGVEDCYFPMFITEGKLNKEKDHIEGFSPEVAWVTRAGQSDLAEPIAIRPTSETAMYPYYATWIRSHRDLPLRLNQWCSVVRWEFKHPQPFLRTREFLWQEGHTAFATEAEADKEVLEILELYRRVYEELLAVPVVPGKKSENEKFAGGNYTTTVEGFIPATGRAIQGATSHQLGQNFSKMFEIIVDNENKERSFVWQNSWGLSTRSIGAMVMVHGDNKGLVMPPRVAKTQVVIVPSGIPAKASAEEKNSVYEECAKLHNTLKKAGIRVHSDLRDNYTPGFKFNHWELRGVPIRLEVGPKDIAKGEAKSVRRDTGEKVQLSLEKIDETIVDLLETIQAQMYQKAKKERDEHLVRLETWDNFVETLNNKNIILSPWCERVECEKDVKERSARTDDGAEHDEKAPSMGAKTLCIPFKQPEDGVNENTKCFACGQKALSYTLWGRSY
ncbi:hypothetical protein HDV06_004082 [Boothiomyces sp. JEL0866]|nr:hypothetical protein HDV06_004082 [Boothiomyces sp. JEL0866]